MRAHISINIFNIYKVNLYMILTMFCFICEESFRAPVFRHGPDKDGFSHGSFGDNFKEVFGDKKLYWLLPMFTRYVLTCY